MHTCAKSGGKSRLCVVGLHPCALQRELKYVHAADLATGMAEMFMSKGECPQVLQSMR